MPSTKIINVLKDDKFEEILDLFKNTQAKEVIFVLPKTSKAFKNEGHFVILENEANKSNKRVSLLCSNPDTNKLANKYNFDVLLAKDNGSKPLITTVNQFDPDDDPADTEKAEEEVADDEKIEEATLEQSERSSNPRARREEQSSHDGRRMMEEETEYEPIEPEDKSSSPVIHRNLDDDEDGYKVVTISKINRGLEDILKQSGKTLKIASQKERLVNLGVKKNSKYEPEEVDIRKVWGSQSEGLTTGNIWEGINKRTQKTFKNFPKKSLVGLGVISIVMFGTIIYISAGNAEINITPKKEPLDVKLKVSSSDKFSSVDVKLNKIPGQLFNIEKTVIQTFATTGEKEVAQKARGKITVFNEYGTTPQPLIATTRFQTPEGLIFRTLKGITIPGTKVENGKIIPGSMSVEVIADKPGQSYNISASKFNIPAFDERDDDGRYEKIYGKSNEAMKGGVIGKAKIVTESDFNTAKQTLSDQLKKDVEDSLKNQTSGLKVINASAVKLKEPESTVKIDEVADNFTMTISGSIKTVGFKEDDMRDLVKQFIDKTQNLIVIPEKLTISYDNMIVDEVGNTLTFTVNIGGTGYSKIDSDKIKTDLSGKNEKEIKDYFKETVATSVESARVILSPFWVKRVPQDREKIKLQINY